MQQGKVLCFRNEANEVLVIPTAKNEAGWGKMINRVHRVNGSASPQELGAAIREAVRECDYSLFDPTAPDPVLKVTGARSYTQLAQKWHQVTVTLSGLVIICPTTRDKKGIYWDLFDEVTQQTIDVNDEVLGAGVLAAFDRCREGRR